MKKRSNSLTVSAAFLVGAMSFFTLAGARVADAQDGCSFHGDGCQSCVGSINNASLDLTSLSGGSYCTRFSACSVNRNLSGASGEELERYIREKSQDGQSFSDWYAPDFTFPNTDGELVSLSDYRGKPVALVFLSGHCPHSLQTIPIITELIKAYEGQNLAILPVYVNSGSVEDVEYLRSALKLEYPLIVSESKDVAEAYESLMVPSVFLIDREGRITKKFVGYKNGSILDEAIAELASL